MRLLSGQICMLAAVVLYCIHRHSQDEEKPLLNPLFSQWVPKFERIPQSHILKPLVPIDDYQGLQYYSAYGVFLSEKFKIGPHRDYQCSLCDGDFIAVMIPKYIHSQMAQVCFEGGCEDPTKGYYNIHVCKEHWTQPGIIDRIQINLYYTNSTKCTSLGHLDEFDCEATLFGTAEARTACSTTNAFLAPLVEQRDLHWDDETPLISRASCFGYLAIAIGMTSLLMAALAFTYYELSGDHRYDHDGIGKIIRLFQLITLSTKPATKEPRKKYVDILNTYIENFNAHPGGDIVGSSEYIKEQVYKRMTASHDYAIFSKISSLMIAIANGASAWNILKVVVYLVKSRIFNSSELVMKISLSATLSTLLCLPDEGTNDLFAKALHYKLIRCNDKNPFVGINACPMISLWQKIRLPKIVNTDSAPLTVVGGVIKYIKGSR